ncbi:MAG: retropepsin-like domain-containing protein [Dehalococcoidia bacterium]|nr:retropepsin-like domain-containing protein [Dehalococcoidia bacterium]
MSFLVDTGSSGCLLGPTDVERLEIDRSRLSGDEIVWGVSGPEHCFVEEGYLYLVDADTGEQYMYPVPRFLISRRSPPEPREDGSVRELPSLLGMELMQHWRMRFSASEGIVEFDVLHCDFPIPADVEVPGTR